MYNLKLHVKPLLESAKTHAFIPHLAGFCIYCIQDSLPLNPMILLSTDMCCDGAYTDLNDETTRSYRGHNLYSLVTVTGSIRLLVVVQVQEFHKELEPSA